MSNLIDKDSKIYVAGHRGLIGSALMRKLYEGGYTNLVYRTHAELDLTRQADVEELFLKEKPECVILNAALPANSINRKTKPLSLMLDNTAIIYNVISSCLVNNVKKLIYVASVAAYPSDASVAVESAGPVIKEINMKPGEIKNEAERYYAMPKLLGSEICRVINKAGSMHCAVLVPAHVYGLEYRYETPDNLPVFPALIRRFSDAVKTGASEVVVWGTGKLRREMTFVDDLADAFIFLLQDDNATGIYNATSGSYVSIKEMTETIKEVLKFQGKITFDTTKPEADEFPLLSTEKLRALGWSPKVNFREGVEKACAYYMEHFG
jgi:GDP-L-fucose synthase